MAKEEIIARGKTRHEKWMQITISEKTLHSLLYDEELDEYEGHRYVKLNINIQDKPDNFGKNITVTRDRYKPSGDRVSKPRTNEPIDATYTERVNQQANDDSVPDSDLPF